MSLFTLLLLIIIILHTHTESIKQHLDVEFEVFIHGKDVVENVLSNARNDAHLVRVVELALKRTITSYNYGQDGDRRQQRGK